MPGGDRTGPLGQGPMTGRGLGFCNPNRTTYSAFGGWGFGAGRGGGRGWRHRFWATGVPGWAAAAGYPQGEAGEAAERNMLENQMQALRTQLDQMQRRLNELSGQESD